MTTKKIRAPLLVSMAWRNIMRNKRRTLLSGGALFLVSVFICLMMSIEYGSMDDMKENIVNHETGDIRIRNPLYTENERITPLGQFVPNTEDVIQTILSIDGITCVEPKIRTGVAVYRGGDTTAATVIGVNSATASILKDRDNIVLEGSLDLLHAPENTFSGKKPLRYAIVSQSFARTFDVHAGDKFTFMTRTATGGTNGCTAIIAAVFLPADNEYRGNVFFMDFSVLAPILRMTSGHGEQQQCMATELLVFTQDGSNAALIEKTVSSILCQFPDLEVIPWSKANAYYSMLELADVIYFLYALVFFLLAATVIFNSTMMSVMERKKEIGSLMSLGMNPGSVRNLFLLETVFVSGISAFAGSLVGAIIVTLFNRVGFDLALIGYDTMEGVNLSTMLYPSLTFGRYVEFFLTGFCTAVIACIIPSQLSLKVQPAEALRNDN